MKTKPNFTYKEFIQKLSNVDINNKDKLERKSPRALKSQNKNISSLNDAYSVKPFSKKNQIKCNDLKSNASRKISPQNKRVTKNNASENEFNQNSYLNLKNTTNKKLKLKNQLVQSSKGNVSSGSKHNQSMKQKFEGNFNHNQSQFQYSKHQESCSNLTRKHFQNQQDFSCFDFTKSTSKQMIKNDSKRSIKFKICTKGKGNLTDRNEQRINTQYDRLNSQDNKSSRIYQRINTQYQNRQSPSFYKKSMDQFNFLEYDQDKTHRTLFPEQISNHSKISALSSYSEQQKMKINQKSHQHIYNQFISKFSETLFQITKIQDQSQLLQHRIKYIEFLQALKDLKLIRNDYEPYSNKEEGMDLIRELWQQLIMGHNINHFIIIVAIILKITPLEQIKQNNPQQLRNYIYLQKKYQQFRYTRLQLMKPKTYTENESVDYYYYPFKPLISKKTQELAQKSRSKKKYKINTSINHNQSSTLGYKGQNVSINTQFDHSVNLHQQSVTSTTNRSKSPLGNKRSQILYQQGKKKSLQKRQRQDKSTIDYQFQKNVQELTFKPKVTIKRRKQRLQDSISEYISPRFALDQQKNVNRMIRGRVQRQIKQITIDKGLPYNQKLIQKLRRQKFQEVIKQQQQSRLKIKNQKSKINITQSRKNRPDKNEDIEMTVLNNKRCTTQVENLENILDLSFQEFIDFQSDKIQFGDLTQNVNRNSPNQNSVLESIKSPLKNSHSGLKNSPLRDSNSILEVNQQDSNIFQQVEQSGQGCIILDIWFEADESQKIIIKKDCTQAQIIQQAQAFVRKHNLPKQMQLKLKKQLINAIKYHDIQRIQENLQEQEYSLLFQR